MEDVVLLHTYGYLVYFVAICYILWLVGIFNGYLAYIYFMIIWYILWLFGIFYGYLEHIFIFLLHREKSGNPAG
jgi:hypothetical protein